MEFTRTVKNNVVEIDPVISNEQALLFLGSPSHTVTPYDIYARFISDDARIAFARAGIPAKVVSCHREVASLHHGSGPEGMVRFGDKMMPPHVQAIIAKEDGEKARPAWDAFQKRKFIRKPVSVIGNQWYDDTAHNPGTPTWHNQGQTGAWITGGTWPHVVGNALEIAKALGKNTGRLETYLLRKKNTSPA